MLQNFKTDIIYFNTPTDFELEFNLCGCCRMRLFNDKCSDKKSFLLSLSKAVSRSRIIFVSAPLFSKDNIVKIVANAIGAKTEVIDNSEYNIASNEEISIIKGALPLVTHDGIFGGCIIESGPQSLVVITDNKTVRKNIMKNLIHPYVKEIALEQEDEEQDNSLITDTTDYDNDEPIYDIEQEALITEVDEDYDAGSFEIDEDLQAEGEGFFTDISSSSEQDDDEEPAIYEDDGDYYTEEIPEKTSVYSILMLIISIVMLVTLAVLCYCIFYIPTKTGLSPSAYLKDIFNTMFS